MTVVWMLLFACQTAPPAPFVVDAEGVVDEPGESPITPADEPPPLWEEEPQAPVVEVVHSVAEPVVLAPDTPLKAWLTPCKAAGCAPKLVFSEPMVEAFDTAAPLVVTTDPPQRGAWAWTSETELSFVPGENAFPWGSEVQLSVNGAESLRGEGFTLAEDWKDTLYVPKLSLAGKVATWAVTPGKPRFMGFLNDFSGEVGSAPLLLLYDQPVQASQVQINITNTMATPLRFRTGRAVDLDYVTDEDVLDHVVAVTLNSALAQDDVLLVRPGDQGEPANTYGLRVNKVFNVTPMEPLDGPVPLLTNLSFSLSGPVRWSILDEHVKISPPPLSKTVYLGGGSATFRLELEPGTDYRISTDTGFVDMLGNSATRGINAQFRSQDLPPGLELPALPVAAEAGRAVLPIRYQNVAKVTVRTHPIDAPTWARMATTSADCSSLPVTHEFVYVPKRREPNIWRQVPLELDTLQGLSCVSLSAVTYGTESQQPLTGASLVQAGNVATTAKVFDAGMFLWATHLDQPGPAADAEVTLYGPKGNPLAKGTTDAQGFANLDTAAATRTGVANTLFLAVRTQDDHAVLRVGEDRLTKAWQFSLKGSVPGGQALQASLFTDRGAYRPGETVHLNVMAGPDEAGKGALVQVHDSRGQKTLTEQVVLNEFGAAHVALPLKKSASVGKYRMFVTVDDRKADHSFRVEEYRVPTFEVSVASKDEWARGADVKATIEADYLRGGGLDGRKMSWQLERAPEVFAPSNFPNYVFSAGTGTSLAGRVNAGKTRLDGTGKAVVDASLGHPSSAGAMRYTLSADVTDVDRQNYAGHLSVVVHPAQFYVGVRPPSRAVMTQGSVLKVPIVAVNPSGEFVPDVVVKARLERIDHHSTTRLGDRHGQTDSRPVPVEMAVCAVTTSEEGASCRFTLKTAGAYRVRAWAKDGKHQDVQSAFEVTATGDNAVAWPRFDRERIELRADRPSYKPGDVAHLVIETPFPEARALLTLERDGVLEHRVVDLKGDTPAIDVPITGEMAPNVYASVVVLRGRNHADVDASGFDTGGPAFRVGYAELKVAPVAQRLNVALGAKTTAIPGESIEVAVDMKDHLGQPVEGQLVVMAVDEAVLGLTGFRTPDPVAGMFREAALGVRTADHRLELPHARRSRLETMFPGGDGGDGGMGRMPNHMLRNLFESTAFFDADVRTDSNGKAKVRFTLPDNTTTYRLMAVAVDKQGRAGSGDTQIQVKRPVMVQAVLPRFVYPNDELQIEALVYNGTDNPGTAEVAVSLTGMDTSAVRTHQIHVDANQVASVKLPVTVNGREQATVRFAVTMGSHTDGVEQSIAVLSPGMRRTEVVKSSGDALTLTLPEDRIPGTTEVEFQVSATALTELRGAVGYLMGYPNGCIEQTTSRAYPLVVLEDLLPVIGVEVDEAELRKYSEAGVRRILSFQTESGGLSYWPGSSEPHAFATAFGLTALIEASKRDYDVPDEDLSRMADYLEATLRKGSVVESIPHGNIADGDTRALFVMTLGRMGRPQPAYVSQLWEERDKLTPFGLSFLGVAAHEMDKDHALVGPILAEVETRARVADNEAWFESAAKGGYSMDSPLRSHASALLAYAEGNGNSDMEAKLLKGLLARQRNGLWGNTQENVFGIMGVYELSKHGGGSSSSDPAPAVQLTHNGDDVTAAMTAVSAQVRRFTLHDEASSHVFQADTFGKPARTSARATYELPLTDERRAARNNGILVERRYETTDGAPIDDIPLGSLVRVTLVVTTSEKLNYVALDDKLPAGLEPLNTSLETTQHVSMGAADPVVAISQALLSYTEMRDHRVAFYMDDLPEGRYEYRYMARATTPGTFLRPPASAEAMYRTDVNGATVADTVVIK
jgi:alpha-2-macroglobulin